MSSTIAMPRGAQNQGNGTTSATPWVYRPWLDLLIGCGAWSAPLLVLTNYVSRGSATGWSFAFYLLALLFNYPHFMATVYRAYHSYDEFRKYRYFTVHVALLLACAGLIAHLWHPLLPWIFTLYICWSPWHYTGQNYGLLMMFARRAGLSPNEGERQALHLSFIASYLMLLFSFHTGKSGDSLIISLGLPLRFTLPVRGTLGLFFIVASVWALFSLARRSSFKALLPVATLVTTQFLWFLLPSVIELITHSGPPQTRYSSGILAVMHSAQYLWITSYYQEKEARTEGKTNWSFARYLLVLVAGGIALFVPGPWIVSRVFHADFATSFLTFTALVNLHHFILDGALWKLRDSRIASMLLDEGGGAELLETPSTGLASAFRWLAGNSAGARILRISAVVCLLIWGAMDRLHFYWANVSANLASIERAARLNPHDSAVQTSLARAAEKVGQGELALRALQNAAEVNPGNIGLQEAYAHRLILAGRDQDAYVLYRRVLDLAPQNANALVNYGLLAQKLGHSEEAVDTWQRAVAADPTQTNAQLYLAQALEQRGESQSAARHYHAYLKEVAKNPPEHSGEGEMVVSALVKVADADAANHRIGDAMTGYRSAAQFAAKLKNPGLQTLALVHAATAQESIGNIGDAAVFFQQALMIDETEGDPHTAAIDWYNYGQFLRRRRQPERLVYACFYRAQDLLSTYPGKELDVAAAELKISEQNLGAAANRLNSQISRLLSEALSLPAASFSK